METRPIDAEKWYRQIPWYKLACVLVLVSAFGLIGANNRPDAKSVIPGWVVVEKSANGDDTAVIQAAIDSVAETGGCVFLPAGTYRHRGLTGRANVHLRGAHVGSVRLDYTPKTGDGITLVADPDFFTISDLSLISGGRSDGWAIRADKRDTDI